jgi:hypothetical protein
LTSRKEYEVAYDFDSAKDSEIKITQNDEGTTNASYYAYRFQPATPSAPVLPPKKKTAYLIEHVDGNIKIHISGELTNGQVLAILEIVQ